VQVLADEIIGRRGRIEARCRVKAHLNRECEPTTNGTGVTVREAIMRAIHRLAVALCSSAARQTAIARRNGQAQRRPDTPSDPALMLQPNHT
jgi:hypothetical protein